jgi:hypothetical protein
MESADAADSAAADRALTVRKLEGGHVYIVEDAETGILITDGEMDLDITIEIERIVHEPDCPCARRSAA